MHEAQTYFLVIPQIDVIHPTKRTLELTPLQADVLNTELLHHRTGLAYVPGTLIDGFRTIEPKRHGGLDNYKTDDLPDRIRETVLSLKRYDAPNANKNDGVYKSLLVTANDYVAEYAYRIAEGRS